MTEWKECKLGELATEITVGFVGTMSDQYVNDGIPFLRSLNIAPYKIKYENLKFISENFHRVIKKSKVHPGDVVIVRTGNPGTALVIPPEFHEGNCSDLVIFRPSDKLDSDFICYYFNLKKEEYSSSHLVGAVQQHFNVGTVRSLPILLPPLAEQKAIAGVLSALDDKIDLLHRQNKTLEAMAEALFRQWFVEEAEESWEEGKLGDLVEVRRGGSPRPIQDYLAETGLQWLKISDVSGLNSPFIFEIKEYIKPSGLKKTVFLKQGSLVVSNSATPGIPKILAIDSCIHDGWLYFPKSELSNEFLYFFFLMIKEELVSQGNGSIFTNLKTDLVREFKLKIPAKSARDSFDEIVKPYFEKQYTNAVQIRSLEKLRDTLLPKLMSGEVRVNE
jgi:type I restriction enzyme S subunit